MKKINDDILESKVENDIDFEYRDKEAAEANEQREKITFTNFRLQQLLESINKVRCQSILALFFEVLM